MALHCRPATLPAAQPSYILRGHAAHIHCVGFARRNTRLLTGDADGWLVYWRVETKRALAVWKAHEGPILGAAEWGCDRIVTHGRDNNLRIWQIRPADTGFLSTTLPVEPVPQDRPKPWLLHTLPVNTLNFCAFSMCHVSISEPTRREADIQPTTSANHREPILVAVPARDDKKVEVYEFPAEKMRYIVPRARDTDTGMVMAVKLVHRPITNHTLVLIGYEGGLTAAFNLPRKKHDTTLEVAQLIYLSQPHTQPILSLDISPDTKTYFTSSADAIIAAHRIPDVPCEDDDMLSLPKAEDKIASTSTSPTEHPLNHDDGTNSTHLASATRVPAAEETQPEPLTFSKTTVSTASHRSPAGLSTLLSSAPAQPKIKPLPPPSPPIIVQPPHKISNTKHSGQQSLRVRSDGRLLVTGGWDTRIRIYSAKTLKEVAVLKWHQEGVYATAFGDILSAEEIERGEDEQGDGSEGKQSDVVQKNITLEQLQRRREKVTQGKHWVVAGAKDGKVSLWEVF